MIDDRFIFRWLVYTLYFSFIVIVPFCYIKIFQYRKNLTIPGSGQTQKEMTKFRKSRNIVTFSYNITIWILETLSAILVQTVYFFKQYDSLHSGFILRTEGNSVFLTFSYFIALRFHFMNRGEFCIFKHFIIHCTQVSFYGNRETDPSLLQISYIVYITVTCGLTPGLYILGNL